MLLYPEDSSGESWTRDGQEAGNCESLHTVLIIKPVEEQLLVICSEVMEYLTAKKKKKSDLDAISVLQEFELRKHARQEGRRYCDPMVLTYQAERMPEQIRLKVSSL